MQHGDDEVLSISGGVASPQADAFHAVAALNEGQRQMVARELLADIGAAQSYPAISAGRPQAALLLGHALLSRLNDPSAEPLVWSKRSGVSWSPAIPYVPPTTVTTVAYTADLGSGWVAVRQLTLRGVREIRLTFGGDCGEVCEASSQTRDGVVALLLARIEEIHPRQVAQTLRGVMRGLEL